MELADAVETQCTIMSYTRSTCQYKCKCDLFGGCRQCSGGKGCNDRCDGDYFDYVVTASDICGQTQLMNNDLFKDDDCPHILRQVGLDYKCYVNGCDAEFSWASGTRAQGNGILWIVLGSLAMCCPCCCIICIFCCYVKND